VHAFAWCRTLETKCKKCGSWCTSLGYKVQKVRNHCPMWCLQVSNPHSSTLKTEATCFFETLVFIYQTTHSHMPGGLGSLQTHLPSHKMKEESFSKIMCCQHKAQIFTIQALLKWNLVKGCSGQGGRDHQESQWHTSQWNHCTTRHQCLCLIWISGLLAQDHKEAVFLQLVCQLDACTSPWPLSQLSFLHSVRSNSFLN